MNFPIEPQEPWAWQPDECPADHDFVKWVRRDVAPLRRILHFGTGGHHAVGLSLSKQHFILGVTASVEEYQVWEKLRIEGHAPPDYLCVFGDMHAFPWALAGRFDIITLFDLGEFDNRDVRPVRDDSKLVLTVAITQTAPGGHIVAYPGSPAWDRVEHLFLEMTREGVLADPIKLDSLLLFRRA